MTEVIQWGHYLPTSVALRDSGLCCRGFGEESGPKIAMRPRRLSTHALLFITEGVGTFASEVHVTGVPVQAPAVIWLLPGIEHSYGPDQGGWHEHWAMFEGTAVRGYEALSAWRRDNPVLDAMTDLGSQIEPVFASLRRGAVTPGRRSELLAATLSHALVGIAADQTERFAERSRGSEHQSVVDLVVSSAFGPSSVAARARLLGLSADRLRREIRDQTSLSVNELVIATRLARAQSLLATTTISVTSIARQVGYDDAAYFSRIFTARVGTAPTTFRREFGTLNQGR